MKNDSIVDKLKAWLWKPAKPEKPIVPSFSVYQSRYMGPNGRIIRSVHVNRETDANITANK